MDRLLDEARSEGWMERWGRGRVKDVLRRVLEESRRALDPAASGDDHGGGEGLSATEAPQESAILAEAASRLAAAEDPSLRSVINGTGVVLHTNLGRAPLGEGVLEAVVEVSGSYSNLEYDLETGDRGSRHLHCVELLSELTGAEASLVVNNNAAAVSLAVNSLAAGREVVVSRGELVEIGGSFRLPDVVSASGARLVEVGTTNRTRLSDYAEACGPETGALLKVHPSNYRLEGFTEQVTLDSLVELGEERELPVIHDLGSGLLRPSWLEGFPREPSPAESLEAGVDVVTWSGDKLLGGPQAGILNGRRSVMEDMRRNPLLRTLRVDKMALAALEATLRLYMSGERAREEIPALRMLTEPAESVEGRARRAAEALRLPRGWGVRVTSLDSVVGGGAYPGFEIPSAGWTVTGAAGHRVADACRIAEPPLVGTVRDGRFRVDFRTVTPGREEAVARILREALDGLAAGDANGRAPGA